MGALRIFEDDNDLYIAEDANGARRIRAECVEENADDDEYGVMREAPDPLTCFDEDDDRVTKSHDEWIAECGGHAGQFASKYA